MRHDGLLHIPTSLSAVPLFAVVPVKLLRLIFFTLRSILVCMIDYVVAINVGSEAQCPFCLSFLPLPHQMLIPCIETSFFFHQPLIMVRRLVIRGNISKAGKKGNKYDFISHHIKGTMCGLFKKVMLSF